MRKFLTTFLVILLICSGFISCTTEPVAQTAVPPSTPVVPTATPKPTTRPTELLSIAYIKDSYNPYLSNNTIVAYIGSLLFCNFVSISPDFELNYHVAQTVTNTGTSVSIILASDLSFADGTPITPEDALQSFLFATTSPVYSSRFSNVADARLSENILEITLTEPDNLFAYLLDIPIMKASELTSNRPTASGTYTYAVTDNLLVRNPYALSAATSPATIALVPVTGYDDMVNNLVLGNINYTVLSESNTNASSTISSSEHYYKTNMLVYLGANHFSTNPLCSTTEGRILLSKLLARQELVTSTYAQRAYVARGILNPFYPCVANGQTISPDSDIDALHESMQLLGYTLDTQGEYFVNERNERATISILVHSANSYKAQLASTIAQNFTEIGIETNIIEVAIFDSFVSLVKSKQFELYIGETKLYNNIDLASFWNGSLSSGIVPSEALLNAYYNFRMDSSTAPSFEEVFASEMPFIPLLWRNGTVATSRNIGSAQPSISDPFYSLENLTVAG